MSKPFLVIPCKKNKLEKVRQLTQILCILLFEDVTGRELDLLCEFIYNGGVNKAAKKSFMLTYRTSSANYGQVVKRLSDKKILFGNPNKMEQVLHPDFEKIKKYYVDDESPNILAVKIL